MIQMQRSISLPGPAHSSTSLLPADTLMTSKHANPAPSNRPAKSPNSHSRHNSESESPYAAYLKPSSTDSKAKPVSEDAIESFSPQNDVKASPPPRINIHKPLLEDISQYTSNELKDAAAEAASTTLEELAHLVRLSKYQERKRSQSRLRLQRSLVSTALSARLARCGDLSHRTLVDSFRSDDKKTFATLYNAIHDVSSSCDATRRFAVLEPDLDIGRPKLDRSEDLGSCSTFMHELTPQTRDTLLNFLTQIRTNPEYLAARICSLTASELSALTLFHQGLDPIDSVLPFYTRPRGQTQNHPNRYSSNVPSPVERLLSFQRHDPLSALIHTCFANSAGPDSAEHLRRTEIWATVCAKLITQNKNGIDPFICSVLNIWTAMREWSGRSNMEWYLMKILEDGAFLLERAEEHAGSRIHAEPRNAKETIAAEEFYDSAIKGLFEIVDDPGAEGIPESVLELGNAILRKLDPKRHGPTKRFLVSKWLFLNFLLNAIVHPESHGMMAEYHITEYARQRILKEIALRAGRLVVDLTWKESAATPPDIRVHIENIMGRFRTKAQKSNPKLLPARSITSLRETIEVRPYLVISPSDLVTMVNALFPDRRPNSGSDKDTHFSGFRSTASSVSGMSGICMPASSMPPPSRGFDTASVVSTSGSSIFSDSTSREPLLDDSSVATHRFSSTSISSMSQSPRLEDEGYQLRKAIRQMSDTLGVDLVSGSCHPCAEQWAVLFMDLDGKNLSMQMLHDNDDDGEEEDETSSSSESEVESQNSRPDLDKDYHQLRDAILKLVEDYEIPQVLDDKSHSKAFSNRTNSLESPRKHQRLRRKEGSYALETQSRNPYRHSINSEKYPPSPQQPSHQRANNNKSVEPVEPQSSVLLDMLEAAEKQCQAQSDFVNAHLWWRTSQQLHQLSSASLRQNGFVSLLNIFSRGPRDSIRHSASAIEEYDAWLVWLKQSQERHDSTIEMMMKRFKALRDKMWYVTDVRNSAAYDTARNVAMALKRMASSKTNKKQTSSATRPRNINRGSTTNNFLLKTETEVLDILAASEEHGGPNKLSDEQADKTSKWLSQYGIEISFCKGEERIHRFCLEIDSCIHKLVGDSLMDGPVLWSSELFYRDKRFLDSGRNKGDFVVSNFGQLSISGDNMPEHDIGHRSLRGNDMTATARSSIRDLRSMSARNGSQQSFSSRSSVVGDIMDSQDYFGTNSPVLAIDSSSTFWSPFQNRVQSPSSASSFRPGTSSTTNETVIETSSENKNVQTKQSFLADLKQTLTALLISDLGTLVFARGSETDSWFSGSLGADCLERRERQEKKSKKKKLRGLEKKRSFRDLRSVNNSDTLSNGSTDTVDRLEARAASRPTTETATPDNHSQAGSSTNGDGTNSSVRSYRSKADHSSTDFPFKASFKKLLTMFSVHPNPYAKLNALYELKQLIIASLTTVPRRRTLRQEALLTVPQSPDYPTGFGIREAGVMSSRAKTLDEAIDNCKERRSHANQVEASSSTRRSADSRPITTSTVASTDMIVNKLEDLFRDMDIRPKSLFRDLQYIATFIPANVLDKTERGKAFWDTAQAALVLKQDVCKTLIEIADEIVVHYTQTRQTSSTANGAHTSRSSLDTEPEVMRYSMQDAARMWTITAKENDPVAERELAIFYLTHPELVERTTLPLTKPRETFKTQVMQMHSGGGEGDRERSDPATMCVAYHWMELSALGGDELAKKYLRQREEMSALP